MRPFARVLTGVALGGLFLSGCAENGVGKLEQLAGQVPENAAGTNGGTAAPVAGIGGTGGTGGGASGIGGGAGMAAAGVSGGAGTSAGTGGMSGGAAGDAASSGSGGMSAGGSGGSSGVGASGSGGMSAAGTGGAAGMTPPPPMPEYLPAADNPPECPDVAPEDPVGDCLGLPVYVVCNYGDETYWYTCTCDWYHWLCAGT